MGGTCIILCNKMPSPSFNSANPAAEQVQDRKSGFSSGATASFNSLKQAAAQLEALARADFPDLSMGELALVRAACTPLAACCGPYHDKNTYKSNDPALSNKWGPEREVRGELIRWLCVNAKAKALVDPAGIQLVGAKITTTLDLNYVRVPFRIALKRCRLTMDSTLIEADIPELDLEGSWTKSINADGIHIRHNLNLRWGFRADGTVSLNGAHIEGSLGCGEGSFFQADQKADAINADAITVGGSVFLRAGTASGGLTPFRALGPVRMEQARIGGELDCSGGLFFHISGGEDEAALNLEGADIKGALVLKAHSDDKGKPEAPFSVIGKLTLKGASAAGVKDDRAGWPSEINLDGFGYKWITSDVKKAETRLEWLGRDKSDSTQPYRQLAKVLADAGDSGGSKLVLERMEARIPDGSPWGYAKATIGYGYAPENAIFGLAIATTVGWIVYRRNRLAMVPTDKDALAALRKAKAIPTEYPPFKPFFYSLENTFPVVTLGITEKYQADPAPAAGKSARYLRIFIWIQILVGWVCATLFIAGVSGLVQHGS